MKTHFLSRSFLRRHFERASYSHFQAGEAGPSRGDPGAELAIENAVRKWQTGIVLNLIFRSGLENELAWSNKERSAFLKNKIAVEIDITYKKELFNLAGKETNKLST